MKSSKEYIDTPPQLTEINELLSLTSRLTSSSLLYKDNDFKVSLKTDYDDSIEQVNLKELDISRALINIITNACQAAHQRSLVKPNLKPEVLIKTRNLVESNSVEISIQDNGSGIPQNILDKIFDPFFTTKFQGTGVGLYFAHDLIVARNGGQILVDSQPGIHTTFTIILPTNVAQILQSTASSLCFIIFIAHSILLSYPQKLLSTYYTCPHLPDTISLSSHQPIGHLRHVLAPCF